MVSITNAFALQTLDALDTLVNTGTGTATINVYSGSVPANVDAALGGATLLAEIDLSNPAFGAATDAAPGGTMSLDVSPVPEANGEAGAGSSPGTAPTFVRIEDRDGAVVCQLTAGVGSGEVNFGANIVSGQPVQITSLTITLAEI